MYAIIAGVLIAGSTIFGIKFCKTENKSWAYPLVLSIYPMFYFGFAIYANDQAALMQELKYSIPIFIICIITAIKDIKYSVFVLSLGYIGHGIYDAVHIHLFENPGMPIWWPEFCGTADIIMGLYLIVYSINLPNKSIVFSENA